MLLFSRWGCYVQFQWGVLAEVERVWGVAAFGGFAKAVHLLVGSQKCEHLSDALVCVGNWRGDSPGRYNEVCL